MLTKTIICEKLKTELNIHDNILGNVTITCKNKNRTEYT